MTPAHVAFALAVVLLAACAAARYGRREGLWFDRWPSENERETFSPDEPGACCRAAGRPAAAERSAAAGVEAAALRVLQGA
jgi:hypothetical protein